MLMLRPPLLACWVHWRMSASQASSRQRSVAFRFLRRIPMPAGHGRQTTGATSGVQSG